MQTTRPHKLAISEVGFGLYPEALRALEAHRSTRSYHEERRHRHPLGYYNISIHRVLVRFLDVLDELGRVHTAAPYLQENSNGWGEVLLSRHESLLYALVEHLEDCRNILAAFSPSPKSAPHKGVIRRYEHEVEEYRNAIAALVNAIKHRQGRLRSIVGTSVAGSVEGYYVEGVLAGGVVGPDPAVHRDGAEAFSYTRDLRIHFAQLFFVGQALAEAIDHITGRTARQDVVPDAGTGLLWEVATKIAGLPDTILPMELAPPYPSVVIAAQEAGTRGFEVALAPAPMGRLSFPGRVKVRVDFMGDGVSRSFRLPGLGQVEAPPAEEKR